MGITSGNGIAFDRAFILEQMKRADDLIYPDEASAAQRHGPQKWIATNVFDNKLEEEARLIGLRAQTMREELIAFADDIKAALSELAEVDTDASLETDKLQDQADQTGGLMDSIIEDEAAAPASSSSPAPAPSPATSSDSTSGR